MPTPRHINGETGDMSRPALALVRTKQAPEYFEDLETDRLIHRLKTGDRAVWDVLYQRYYDRVYGYALTVLRDRHEAEDVAQEVFTRTLSALARYEIRSEDPFRSWLFSITRNAVIDNIRKTHRCELRSPEEIDEARDVQTEEPHFASLGWISDPTLSLLIDRLPENQRLALILRYMLIFNTREIAAALDCTPRAVNDLDSRARAFLRDRLARMGRASMASERSQIRVSAPRAPMLEARRLPVDTVRGRRQVS
jgi:RNA polymerase sigma-70 factor (ECF subfamily)